MEAERGIFPTGDRRPDADEREPYAATFAGTAHGRVGRAHRIAKPEFVSELFADRGGTFAHARDAAGAGDFADRSRRRYFASTWGIASRAISGAVGAVVAADGAAERCGGEILFVV